jgi:hypothetical protein
VGNLGGVGKIPRVINGKISKYDRFSTKKRLTILDYEIKDGILTPHYPWVLFPRLGTRICQSREHWRHRIRRPEGLMTIRKMHISYKLILDWSEKGVPPGTLCTLCWMKK